MADGALFRAPVVHEPGVYLDLPMHAYVRDRALSGSAFRKLLYDAPAWWWEHPDNPLWREPVSDARDLGTAIHKAVLEGLPAYEAAYVAEPDRAIYPHALDTARDMSGWIKRRNEELAAAGEQDEKGKPRRLNVSGSKDELAVRIRDEAAAYDLDVTFWDDLQTEMIAGRELVKRYEDEQIRLVEGFLRRDRTYAKLLSGGLPEASIFWEADGVRYKARLDYLRAAAIVDLKSFGRSPSRSLVRDFLADRINHGDDLQAVHAARAVAQIPNLEIRASGPDATARIDLLRKIAPGEKVFVWIGARVFGGPTALAVRFDKGGIIWGAAEQKIERAVEVFRDYRARFGDDVWIRSEGLIEPDISEWPYWATEVPL